MDAFTADLFRAAADNNALVGAILFVLTLLEALLVVGLLIPIVGVMLAAGALVANGALHPVEAILWCSAGAAARYLGPARPFIPILAGISRTRPWSFHFANVLSAPIWVISLLAPGYLAARNLQMFGSDPALASGIALALILAVGGGVMWFKRSQQPAAAA